MFNIKFRNSTAILFGASVILAVGVSLQSYAQAGKKATDKEGSKTPVKIEAVQLSNSTTFAKFEGSTFPSRYTTIRSSQSGYVERILVADGTRINNGQQLASIDQVLNKGRQSTAYNNLNIALLNLYKAEIDLKSNFLTLGSSKSRLDIAEAQYEAEKELFAQNLSSDALLNQALANFNDAKASYQNKEASIGGLTSADIDKINFKKEAAAKLAENPDISKLEFKLQSNIQAIDLQHSLSSFEIAKTQYLIANNDYKRALGIAPFSGQVLRVIIEEGQFVQAGDALFTLGNLDQLKINLYVSERDLPAIKVNNTVKVQFNSLLNQEFEGKIISRSLDSDPTNRGYKVVVQVANPKGMIVSGQSASVALPVYNNTGKILVPLSAVLQAPKESYVFLANGDKATKKVVITGEIIASNVEIKSGLAVGDKLIVTSQQFLKDNDPITVR